LLVSLWIVIILTEGYLLGILLGRHAYRVYPAFTAFVGFCTIRSLVLFYIANNAMDHYYAVVWGSDLPQSMFLVALLIEVFRGLFSPLRTLPQGTVSLFMEAGVGCLAIVAALTAMCPGEQYAFWLLVARAVDEGTSRVMLAVFILIAMFASYLGIPWRHRQYGIGLGFLVYLCTDVVVTTIAAHFSTLADKVWPVDMCAFLIACALWVYYFIKPDVPRNPVTTEQLRHLETILSSLRCSIADASDNRRSSGSGV
jgi:hypothetical protein